MRRRLWVVRQAAAIEEDLPNSMFRSCRMTRRAGLWRIFSAADARASAVRQSADSARRGCPSPDRLSLRVEFRGPRLIRRRRALHSVRKSKKTVSAPDQSLPAQARRSRRCSRRPRIGLASATAAPAPRGSVCRRACAARRQSDNAPTARRRRSTMPRAVDEGDTSADDRDHGAIVGRARDGRSAKDQDLVARR